MQSQPGLPPPLDEATRLLFNDPARSERISRQFLQTSPNHEAARLLLAAALREQNNPAGALEWVEPLAHQRPGWPGAQLEYALALSGVGRHRDALAALSRIRSVFPDFPGLDRHVGDAYFALGDMPRAHEAYAASLNAALHEPALEEGWNALHTGNLVLAEERLSQHLARYPTDPLALRAFSEVYARQRRYDEAEKYLVRCLERAPSYGAARFGYALVLFHLGKFVGSVRELDVLLQEEPDKYQYLTQKAAALNAIGDFAAANECYERILRERPSDAAIWVQFGHNLRTLGRSGQAIDAYRKAVSLNGASGEAYFGLANLKTFAFEPPEIELMQKQLRNPLMTQQDRIHFNFALGKALEDRKDYEAAFKHYAEGNALSRAQSGYDPEQIERLIGRSKSLLTKGFFDSRAGFGSPSSAPIFVVGMPRSGSTLVEQILSSHSQVEGTMELTDILAFAERLAGGPPEKTAIYPESLMSLSAADTGKLGQEYLDRTQAFRRLDRIRFLDKMPNNFLHVGLIHLILPNAKIIDVRRHPLSCCWSNFKQLFATGQPFAYSLEDLGRYYRGYVDLMAHYDAVLPGRVYRLIYENLVGDTEAEIRWLLTACDLPFEAQCLRFYETERAVRTPSSEQVRRPVFSEGMDNWRPFEPWLEPLKAALGPVLDSYPQVPFREPQKR